MVHEVGNPPFQPVQPGILANTRQAPTTTVNILHILASNPTTPLSTLASLRLLSKTAYGIVTPSLYRSVTLSTDTADGVLGLGEKGHVGHTLDVSVPPGNPTKDVESSDVDGDGHSNPDAPSQPHNSDSDIIPFVTDKYSRRAHALKHIKSLTFLSPPPPSVSSFLLLITWPTRNKPFSHWLLPNLDTLIFHPEALATPQSRMLYYSPFFQALELACAPKHIWATYSIDTYGHGYDQTPPPSRPNATRSLPIFDRGPLLMQEWLDNSSKNAIKSGAKHSFTSRLESLSSRGIMRNTIPAMPGKRHQVFFESAPKPKSSEGVNVNRPRGAMRHHMHTPDRILLPSTRRLDRASAIRGAIQRVFISERQAKCQRDGRSGKGMSKSVPGPRSELPGSSSHVLEGEAGEEGKEEKEKNKVDALPVLAEPVGSIEFIAFHRDLGLVNEESGSAEADAEARWIENKVRNWVGEAYGGKKWIRGTGQVVQDRIRFVRDAGEVTGERCGLT